MNKEVDAYIDKATKWKEEMKLLRKIILDCELEEEVKWNKPCYTFQGKNIVIIQDFKKYLALLFFKGYLLEDTKNILVKTGENTQTGRQIRFADIQQINKMEVIIKTYISEAIDIEKNGIKNVR